MCEKCARCGKQGDNLYKVDGQHWCSICRAKRLLWNDSTKKMQQCTNCGLFYFSSRFNGDPCGCGGHFIEKDIRAGLDTIRELKRTNYPDLHSDFKGVPV